MARKEHVKFDQNVMIRHDLQNWQNKLKKVDVFK